MYSIKMSFLSGLFSSNYKAKDFVDKTPKQILDDMKMDKLTAEIVNDEGYGALSEETKNAIQMLLDLKKGKLEIYTKCYNKPGHAAAAVARPASIRPASVRPAAVARPASAMLRPASAMPRPFSSRPPPVVHAGPYKAAEEQTGGRRKRRTGRKKRATRKARKTRKR